MRWRTWIGLAAAVGLAGTVPALLGSPAAALVTPTVTSLSDNGGPPTGGETITVHGSGFVGPLNACNGNVAISFGADPAWGYEITAKFFQVVSDTQINVVVPPNYGGAVDVRVTNSCGESAVNAPADRYTYAYDTSNQCISGPCTFGVDATQVSGAITHAANGFNGGYNTDAGSHIPAGVSALMQALHPTSWRVAGGLQGMFQLARGSGASVTALLETDWLNASGGNCSPWTDLATFHTFVRTDATNRLQQGTAPDWWDVWNEPGGCPGQTTTPTVNQILSVYSEAYGALNEAYAPTVPKVIGPSISSFNTTPAGNGNQSAYFLDLTTFASWANQWNLHFAAITYHDIGSTGAPGVVGVPRTLYDPGAFADDVQAARAVIAQYPGLGNPALFVNEYGPSDAYMLPGWTVGAFEAFERAGVDQASRMCDPAAYCTEQMDGLFTPDGQTQMPYWVYDEYATMTGQRVATTPPGRNITGLATRNDASQTVQVLVGRHDQCAPPPRPNKDAAPPPSTCPWLRAPVHGAVSMTVPIHVPYGYASAHVSVRVLPNSATGLVAPAAQPTATASTVPVVNGVATVPVGSIGDGDAVSITVSAGP